MEYHTRPRGSPEENERRATDAVRQDRIARARLATAPGFVLAVVVTAGV
jgi:hypothetical protein